MTKRKEILRRKLYIASILTMMSFVFFFRLSSQKPTSPLFAFRESVTHFTDEEEAIITGSTTIHLTLSVPKSGTTALSWIVSSLFQQVEDLINKRGQNELAQIYLPDKQTTLVWKNSKISYLSTKKHRGVLHQCRNGKVKKAVEFPFDHHLNLFLKTNHSADTDYFRNMLKQSKSLKVAEDNTSCRGDVKHIAIFRDPIATAVSYQKYLFPSITKEEISEILIRKACDKRPALTAAVWILSTEIMPSFDFNIQILFYRDLLENPVKFVDKFSKILGLNVNSDIINNVVNETSPDNMRRIQEEMKILPKNSTRLKELRKRYHGLSGNGQNSRKVRTATLKGYENEITYEALEYCRERARFHLPQELLEKFNLT